MAKLTIEEAKAKLAPIALNIEKMKEMGIEVHQLMIDEFNRLTKIITGNSSNNLAEFVNGKILVQVNANQAFVQALADIIGTKQSLQLVVVTAEDGSKSIKAEPRGSGSAGGQKSGTASGGTKASTPYNHYTVKLKQPLADYKAESGEFTTAKKAVEFILNNGKNPMNLGADWQAGNSMVRALNSLASVEGFTSNFEVVCEYRAKAEVAEPTVAEPVAE